MIVDPEAEKPEDWDDEDDGDWEAPTVPNPAYKGPWEHPQIPNPDYKEVNNPGHRLPINFVGFDLWQVKSGTLFGDIILADSEEDLNPFLWDKEKFEAEKEAKKAFDKANEPPEEEDEDEESDMEELSDESGEAAEKSEAAGSAQAEAAEKTEESAHD